MNGAVTALLVLVAFTFPFSISAVAQSVAPAAAAPAEPKKTYVTFGFDERVRNEDWNNILELSDKTDDERRQMRYRTRIWLNLESKPIDFGFRLADEFYSKIALKPSDSPAYKLNFDEVVIDNLYLNFKKLGIKGLSASVGRQELQRGEGFLIFDGTSGDGSRSMYFNAIDIAYQHKKTKYELLGILDPRQDRFLGIIHDQQKYLQEWDEQAVGFYYTNRERKDLDVDSYYIYKREVNDYRSPLNPYYQPDRNVSTVGARIVKRFSKGYSLSGEFADQFGGQHANVAKNQPAADIRAWGGYIYATKNFDVKWKPSVTAGYWAMSGDDPNNSTTVSGFDPIFSRWPKYSELEVYALIPEHGIAYWTNIRMFQAQTAFNPTKALTVRATFYEQSAFHPVATSSQMFGTGTHRGENYQVRADYAFSERWKCHVLYENFVPGSFYKGTDDSFFFQAQLMFQFSHKFQIKD